MKKLILLLAILLLQNLSYAQNYAVIGATDVKMRTIANTNSEIVTMLQLGDVAEILDESHDYVRVSGVDKPYKWFKLKVNNKIGWFFGAFVFSKINKFERISSGNSEGFLVGSFANQTNDYIFRYFWQIIGIKKTCIMIVRIGLSCFTHEFQTLFIPV